MSETSSDLTVRRRPRRAILGWLLALVLVVGLALWWVNHPRSLPTTKALEGATAPGQPIYLGVFTPPEGFDRSLDISGVKVRASATADVEVTPLLCRGGHIVVTTDPAPFCPELVDPAGTTLTADDSILLRVEGDLPATADIDVVRLGFREGAQWGTLQAGSPAVVRILGS